MPIGLVQSAERSGTRSLTYDDKTKSFRMEGAGEILPAKLIDLANRQQILWTDLAVRDWTLRTASALLRETKTETGRSRARAAAAALASATGKHASSTRAPARVSGRTLRKSNGRLPSAPSEELTPVPSSASGMAFNPAPAHTMAWRISDKSKRQSTIKPGPSVTTVLLTFDTFGLG